MNLLQYILNVKGAQYIVTCVGSKRGWIQGRTLALEFGPKQKPNFVDFALKMSKKITIKRRTARTRDT